MLFNILVFWLQAWNIYASHLTCESAIGYIFAFGDSYTTIGFNISGPQPTESNPIGNPTDDHATSAAGPIWVEYLTFTYNNSLILTYDFAVSGAAINNSLIDQITAQYEPKYSTSKFWNDEDSIFMVWIGINDITQLSHLYSNDTDWNLTLLPRFDQYFHLMDNVYDTGARKFFLVNMPPLDRTPMILNHTADIIENFRLGVDVFNNDLLPKYAQWFRGNHSDSQMLVYDAHSIFEAVLDNAPAYGYINNTCMNTTSCFWWNDYHPETSFHRILAQDMTTSLTDLGWCTGGGSARDL